MKRIKSKTVYLFEGEREFKNYKKGLIISLLTLIVITLAGIFMIKDLCYRNNYKFNYKGTETFSCKVINKEKIEGEKYTLTLKHDNREIKYRVPKIKYVSSSIGETIKVKLSYEDIYGGKSLPSKYLRIIILLLIQCTCIYSIFRVIKLFDTNRYRYIDTLNNIIKENKLAEESYVNNKNKIEFIFDWLHFTRLGLPIITLMLANIAYYVLFMIYLYS